MLPLLINSTLSLHLWQEEDAEEAFTLIDGSRAHLERWVQWAEKVRSVEELRGFIRYSVDEHAAGKTWQFAIRQHGSIVGGIGLVCGSRHHAELGYWLGAAFCGQGIVTDAGRALTRFGFDTLPLEWVEIRCASENQRSRAVAERLSFSRAGLIPEAQWTIWGTQDAVLYRLAHNDDLPRSCSTASSE